MQVRVLGAHQWESRTLRCAMLLIDGILAIDAGSLAAALSLEEQAQLQGILITHRHYDHVKDLPAVAFNVAHMGLGPLPVIAAAEVEEALRTHIVNGGLWPRLTEYPSIERPALRFVTARAQEWIELAGYRIRPVLSIHSIPTFGYQIIGRDGRCLYYTADTGVGWVAGLPDSFRTDLLVTEVTFSDQQADAGEAAKHLTPTTLGRELIAYSKRFGSIPPVVVIHLNPVERPAIDHQLADLARQMDLTITIGAEDLVLNI